MKIVVNVGVSENTTSESFNTEDLGYSDSEWLELSESEKKYILQSEIFELPSQPYWMLDSFEEK